MLGPALFGTGLPDLQSFAQPGGVAWASKPTPN